MKFVGFFLCLLLIHVVVAFHHDLFKHLTPKPGGIIDTLTKPKLPGGGRFTSHFGGGLSLGIGSFGFNFGINKQYVPPGAPPNEPHIPEVVPGYPDGNPYVPGVKPGGIPDGNPYDPGMIPGIPVGNPYVPGGHKPARPHVPEEKPGITWEEENGEKFNPHYPRPNYPGEDDKDYAKPPDSHEDGKVDYPKKPGPYEEEYPKRKDTFENNEDPRPDWEDIGEKVPENKDPRSENFMNGDLTGSGLIQPRLNNKNRSKRFIESRVFHVPLLFRSNAKPYQVKVQSKFNSFEKESLEK